MYSRVRSGERQDQLEKAEIRSNRVLRCSCLGSRLLTSRVEGCSDKDVGIHDVLRELRIRAFLVGSDDELNVVLLAVVWQTERILSLRTQSVHHNPGESMQR